MMELDRPLAMEGAGWYGSHCLPAEPECVSPWVMVWQAHFAQMCARVSRAAARQRERRKALKTRPADVIKKQAVLNF